MVFGAGKASVQASKGLAPGSVNFTGFTEVFNTGNGVRLNDIANDGSLFVCVGDVSGDAEIYTSPDGDNWTERSNPSSTQIVSVAYGAGIFVCVGLDDGANGLIMSSTNGTSWTKRTAGDAIYDRVSFDSVSGLFFAVGRDQTSAEAQLATSSNGTSWTKRSIPGVNDFARCWDVYRTSGSTPLIGIGQDTGIGTDPKYIHSSNGTSWSGPTFMSIPGGNDDSPQSGVYDAINDVHIQFYQDEVVRRANQGNGQPGAVITDYNHDSGFFVSTTRILQPIDGGAFAFYGSDNRLAWANPPDFGVPLNTLTGPGTSTIGCGIHYGFDGEWYICGLDDPFGTPRGKIWRITNDV